MTCPNCKTECSPETKFCPNCGLALGSDKPPVCVSPVNGSFFRRNMLLIFIGVGALVTFLFIFVPSLFFLNFLGNVASEAKNQELKAVTVSGTGTSKIALINIDGEIVEKDAPTGIGAVGSDTTSSRQIKRTLQDVEADKKVKAVLLRIDSPGGGTVASEEIYEELNDFKQRTGLPIVAYFSDLAASGAYYVSMTADEIVANPQTITGSIGVILSYINYGDLADKYGVKEIVFKSGPHKDLISEFRTPTDEEKKIMQSLVDESFERFVQVVARGRKISEEQVRTLADGRVYSANQAVNLKLADKLGTFEMAVADARKAAGIKEATVVEFGQPGFWESLFSSLIPRINLSALSGLSDSFLQKPGIRTMYLYTP